MASRPATWASGIALAALAALSAGSVSGCRIDTGDLSQAKHARDVAYRVDQPVKALQVTAVAGGIRVVGREGTGVAVTEHQRYDDKAPRTRHEVKGDTLVLDSTCPDSRACLVGYRIEVPRGTAVDVRSDAGAIRVSGVSGTVRARTSAGAVEGDDLRSPEVTVESTAGAVTLAFRQAPTAVEARATAGSVTVRLPGDQRYAVDATTDAGSTRVSVPQDPASAHRVKASSSAGSVTVLST